MIIFPAIDIKDGQAVRLTKGDFDRVKVYGDPMEAASAIRAAGAEYLHAVDLDGAKDGEMSNYTVIRSIVREFGLFVEVGGGIRDYARIETYLEAGVGRVILGTAAVRDPAFLSGAVARFGAERVAAGVDVSGGYAAVDGWQSVTDRDGASLIREMRTRGVEYVIYTDIAKDGMLSGANLEAYRNLSAIEGLKLTASGGITGLGEIGALKAMGLYAAIIGKAMYEGYIDLGEAIRAAK